jgi:hypothetical protein
MPIIHVCQPGDCLARVAWRYLLMPEVVSGHPGNRALLSKRKDPTMLFPGDRLTIPEGKQPTFTLATGKHHRIELEVPRKELRLVVKDAAHEPLANKPYKLTLDKGPEAKRKRSGTTDGNGMLREPIPIQCTSGLLEVADWRIALRLGFLQPLPADEQDPATGVEERLRALGYAAGNSGRPPEGKPRTIVGGTRVALALFQTDQGLDVTGELDDASTSKIKEDFGC